MTLQDQPIVSGAPGVSGSLAMGHALLLAACGGACGAVLRALLAWAAAGLGLKAPWGTLAANVLGCAIAGVLLGATRWAGDPAHPLRHLVMVGVLGGLTTFSAFSLEAVQLMQQGKVGMACAHVCANLTLGMGAVWLGWTLTR